jgi:hypothetical protein
MVSKFETLRYVTSDYAFVFNLLCDDPWLIADCCSITGGYCPELKLPSKLGPKLDDPQGKLDLPSLFDNEITGWSDHPMFPVLTTKERKDFQPSSSERVFEYRHRIGVC